MKQLWIKFTYYVYEFQSIFQHLTYAFVTSACVIYREKEHCLKSFFILFHCRHIAINNNLKDFSECRQNQAQT